MYPNVEVIEEFVHPHLEFSDTGQPMVFDVYIPALKLAFEYHGYHHFHEHCKILGVTLVQVPYWWQRDKESITSALHNFKPDLRPDESQVVGDDPNGSQTLTKIMPQCQQ